MSCRDERLCFGGLRLMLVIKLVSKWEICWALWSLVVFDPIDDLTRPEMGDFLRLSPWSEGLGQQAQAVALMDKPLGGSFCSPL